MHMLCYFWAWPINLPPKPSRYFLPMMGIMNASSHGKMVQLLSSWVLKRPSFIQQIHMESSYGTMHYMVLVIYKNGCIKSKLSNIISIHTIQQSDFRIYEVMWEVSVISFKLQKCKKKKTVYIDNPNYYKAWIGSLKIHSNPLQLQ